MCEKWAQLLKSYILKHLSYTWRTQIPCLYTECLCSFKSFNAKSALKMNMSPCKREICQKFSHHTEKKGGKKLHLCTSLISPSSHGAHIKIIDPSSDKEAIAIMLSVDISLLSFFLCWKKMYESAHDLWFCKSKVLAYFTLTVKGDMFILGKANKKTYST